jgi:FdhE protein
MNQVDADMTRYSKIRPQYQESLDFLRRVLDFQVSLMERLESAPPIEVAMAREKWQVGLPLFQDESPSIPAALFREALTDLRPILPKGAIRLALDQLLDSNLMAPANVELLLYDLRSDGDSCIERLAEATSAEPDMLAFLLRTVLSPFFEKQAVPYREWVDATAWRRGICPMCGSEPAMARLAQDDGQRLLACSLCHTEWTFDRLRCPFCESQGQPLLRHFTVDDDQAHRVDCCDQCQRYLKTVDERKLGRLANLPVEEVITPYLDVLAGEQGYQ